MSRKKNLPQEILDITRNLTVMGFECEVSAVHELHHGVRQVTLEGFGSGRNEGRVVLPPHGQKARLMLSEVPLEFRIETHIALVIENEIALHLSAFRQLDVRVVQRVSVRTDAPFRSTKIGIYRPNLFFMMANMSL